MICKNPRSLILGTLLAAAVGGTAVQGWRMTRPVMVESQPVTPSPVLGKPKPKVATAPKPMGERQLSKAKAGGSEVGTGRVAGGVYRNAGQAASNPLNHPSAAPLFISERELQRRAAQVEQEANHDLKHLVGLLDLTEAQQDKIFDSIVRHTPGWNPVMQTVGVAVPVDSTAKTPGTSGTSGTSPGTNSNAAAAEPTPESISASRSDLLNEIAADLTPDQQIELANAELDRQEWWEEIIPQLLPGSDLPSITGGTGTGTGTAAAAALPPADDEPVVLEE